MAVVRHRVCHPSPGHRRGRARGQASVWVLALIAGWGVLASVSTVRAQGLKWELDTRDEGVVLYTAEVDAHGYDVVKAVAVLPVPVSPIVARLRDFTDYPRWYHACVAVRVLERPRAVAPLRLDERGRFVQHAVDESYLLLYVQDASPLDNRWALVVNELRIVGGSLHISFHSVNPRGVRPPEGAVEMRLSGRWILSPLSPERTRVTFILDVDPNTSTPAFLVDSQIHDIALRTLQNLKRLMTRTTRRK